MATHSFPDGKALDIGAMPGTDGVDTVVLTIRLIITFQNIQFSDIDEFHCGWR